mmetsp:Transcript_17918/g.34997  ORF Transcript_17918/g.34997 Transcript_17918/m.34997 type:complete len:248 (-) Transcript_17918:599-1342(-)
MDSRNADTSTQKVHEEGLSAIKIDVSIINMVFFLVEFLPKNVVIVGTECDGFELDDQASCWEVLKAATIATAPAIRTGRSVVWEETASKGEEAEVDGRAMKLRPSLECWLAAVGSGRSCHGALAPALGTVPLGKEAPFRQPYTAPVSTRQSNLPPFCQGSDTSRSPSPVKDRECPKRARWSEPCSTVAAANVPRVELRPITSAKLRMCTAPPCWMPSSSAPSTPSAWLAAWLVAWLAAGLDLRNQQL